MLVPTYMNNRKHGLPPIVRQEVKWVDLPHSRFVTLDGVESPLRVWTIYTHTDPLNPPTLPLTPVHNQGFFLEDYVHDWTVVHDKNGTHLRYASRLVGQGVWILLEYVEPGKCPWGKKPKLPPSEPCE